jgi:hypothetical protein
MIMSYWFSGKGLPAVDRKLDAVLLDPGWLTAKLTATGNTAALVADYDRYAVGEPQKLIGRTPRLIDS